MEDVLIRIDGIKFPGEPDEETCEFMTEGKMYLKNDSIYLTYEESEMSGFEGCNTTLKLSGNKVVMMRFGKNKAMNTRMEFEEGKPYEGNYGTPLGNMPFRIETLKIINQMDEIEGGYLSVDYSMSLLGLYEGRNILAVRVKRR